MMLQVSDTASTELKKIFETGENSDKNLVLYFLGSGCSGPSLGMGLEDTTEGLEKLESNGIQAYLDPKLNDYLKAIGDIKIDYVSSNQGEGYTIKVGDMSCDKSGCSCC